MVLCRGLEDVAAEEALAALNLGHPEHKWDAVRVTYFGAVLLVPDSPGNCTLVRTRAPHKQTHRHTQRL